MSVWEIEVPSVWYWTLSLFFFLQGTAPNKDKSVTPHRWAASERLMQLFCKDLLLRKATAGRWLWTKHFNRFHPQKGQWHNATWSSPVLVCAPFRIIFNFLCDCYHGDAQWVNKSRRTWRKRHKQDKSVFYLSTNSKGIGRQLDFFSFKCHYILNLESFQIRNLNFKLKLWEKLPPQHVTWHIQCKFAGSNEADLHLHSLQKRTSVSEGNKTKSASCQFYRLRLLSRKPFAHILKKGLNIYRGNSTRRHDFHIFAGLPVHTCVFSFCVFFFVCVWRKFDALRGKVCLSLWKK